MTPKKLFLFLLLTATCCQPALAQQPVIPPIGLTFTLTSYSVPAGEAQAAVAGLSPSADALGAMQKISTSKAAKTTASAGVICRSGQRSLVTTSRVKMEIDPAVGPDGKTVSLGADITVNQMPLKVKRAMVQTGTVYYAGTIEVPGSDKVEVVFIRVQTQ